MPLWLKEKLFQKTLLRDEMKRWQPDFDWHKRLLFGEHHQSHAASAFFPSPFEEAAVLTMDGVGEWTTTSLGLGQGNKLEMLKEIHFPHSLGLLYSAFTYYTGFKVNSGEYKVMGLAPYGEPKYVKDLILEQHRRPQGGRLLPPQPELFRLLHRPAHDERASSTRCSAAPPRKPEELLTPAAHGSRRLGAGRHRGDRAAAGPLGDEGDRRAEPLPGRRRGAELRRQRQAAARRACSTASGCSRRPAMPAARSARRSPPITAISARRASSTAISTAWQGSYLGPEFDQTTRSRERLTAAGARFDACWTTTQMIDARRPRRWPTRRRSAGCRAAWSSGRARWAPARSWATRARPTMQKTLNLKVKYRESFRPFAPAVLREDVGRVFRASTTTAPTC